VKRLVLAVAVLLLAGCGNTFEVTGPDAAFRGLRCSAGDRVDGMIVLLAQSVPAVPAVPCVRESPGEWTVKAFEPRDGRAHLRLADPNDTMSFDADVVRTCDRGGATQSVSEQPGMRRYDRIRRSAGRYRLDRYYTAPGSCVAFHFDGGGIHADRAAEDVMKAFGFITRVEIDRAIARSSGGRLHLDPEP
jgi:hypothetical protein